MSRISQVAGKAIPVRGNEIDTDRIIPARFMRTITFDGLGEYAFYDARFDSKGKMLEHPFNNEKYAGASILVANKNFGCGSSREHAPQALMRWGIKAIIGESFAEIFAGNCQMLGIPCVTASQEDVELLQGFIEKEDSDAMVNLNLEESKASFGDTCIAIRMPEARKKSLKEGTWDTLGMLVQNIPETRKNAEKIPYLNHFK